MQLSKLENILISLQYMRQWWRYVDYILYFLHKYRQLYADVIMQVSAYLLGEYNHLLARRPGCSPKDIFVIIHEKLPTVSWVFLFLYIYVFFCDHHLFFLFLQDSNNIHSSLNIRKDFDALSTTRSRITKPDLGNIQQVSL